MAETDNQTPENPKNSEILAKVLDRRDQMGVSNYWIAKRAAGSVPGVYNFLRGKSDPNLRTLESVLKLMGLQVSEMEEFKKVD